MHLKKTTETHYFLETLYGILNICVGPNGLSYISFEDCSKERIRKDAHFRDAFVNWLHEFQNKTISERWNSLAPQGTDFQKAVWRALLDIPSGSTISYSAIAIKIQRPKAWRAVGSAVGANPISLLIPCHRVVPVAKGIGRYRWGSERKRELIKAEETCNGDFTQIFKIK